MTPHEAALTSHLAEDRVPAGRWYMVAVLTLLVILSYIDRTALSLLVAPIKQDLGLTDTQLSYLLGLSFALFYGSVSIPAGYLVDRFPRQPLLLAAILFWSMMTLGSGFAGSFLVLLFCRTGVGIGEAALAPGAYSLIGDGFRGKDQSRAFTIFSLGNAVGAGLALVIVGYLLDLFARLDTSTLPFLTQSRPWQLVLLTLGAAGLPCAFLILTFREPSRRGESIESPTFAAAFQQLRQQRRYYVPLYLANFLIGVCLFGLIAWGPAMIGRAWGLGPGEVGKTYGFLQIVASLIGLVGTGFVLERLDPASRYRSVLKVGGIALLTGGIALAFAPHMPSIGGMWALLALVMLILPCAPIVVALTITYLTPSRMVGKFSALSFLLASAFGTAVGPTLIAFLSDTFFTGPAALGYGVTFGGAFALMLAALTLLWLSYHMPDQPVSDHIHRQDLA